MGGGLFPRPGVQAPARSNAPIGLLAGKPRASIHRSTPSAARVNGFGGFFPRNSGWTGIQPVRQPCQPCQSFRNRPIHAGGDHSCRTSAHPRRVPPPGKWQANGRQMAGKWRAGGFPVSTARRLVPEEYPFDNQDRDDRFQDKAEGGSGTGCPARGGSRRVPRRWNRISSLRVPPTGASAIQVPAAIRSALMASNLARKRAKRSAASGCTESQASPIKSPQRNFRRFTATGSEPPGVKSSGNPGMGFVKSGSLRKSKPL